MRIYLESNIPVSSFLFAVLRFSLFKNMWVVKIFAKVSYVTFYLNLNLKGGGRFHRDISRRFDMYADPCCIPVFGYLMCLKKNCTYEALLNGWDSANDLIRVILHRAADIRQYNVYVRTKFIPTLTTNTIFSLLCYLPCMLQNKHQINVGNAIIY